MVYYFKFTLAIFNFNCLTLKLIEKIDFLYFSNNSSPIINSISAVLLRGLDALTTEDAILNSLMQLTNLPLKSVKVGRDSLTNTSRGICYVEMNSVVDAMFLHNQLLGEPPTIDDKLVSVSYFRPPLNSSSNQSSYGSSGPSNRDSQPTAAANAALAAAQWSHQGRQGIASQYGHDDIERMAEYSASLYAKTASEKAHYLEYYRNYYKNGGGKEESKEASESSKPQTPLVPVKKDQGKVHVNGVEYPRYRKFKLLGVQTSFGFGKKNLKITKRKKNRESFFRFLQRSADLPSI